MMNWRKWLALSVLGTSFSLLLLTVVFGWLVFIDGTVYRPVVTYDHHVFPVENYFYSPGEIVKARIEAYKSRDLVGEVRWSLVNHRITYFAPRELPLPSGVVDGWFPVEKLPSCEMGEYHFEGLVSYKVNFLRTVTYKVKTGSFRIIPAVTTSESDHRG